MKLRIATTAISSTFELVVVTLLYDFLMKNRRKPIERFLLIFLATLSVSSVLDYFSKDFDMHTQNYWIRMVIQWTVVSLILSIVWYFREKSASQSE
ncbi:MAG: hypothetical protein ABI378_10920 [Chitinophagaceae bacterium]